MITAAGRYVMSLIVLDGNSNEKILRIAACCYYEFFIFINLSGQEQGKEWEIEQGNNAEKGKMKNL